VSAVPVTAPFVVAVKYVPSSGMAPTMAISGRHLVCPASFRRIRSSDESSFSAEIDTIRGGRGR
jgi:hypothetical protein